MMVVFYLDEQRYAVPVDAVQEIQQIVAFSTVPGGHHGVVGMVNLRGDIIPAIDVRVLVGLPAKEHDIDTPMIICHTDGYLIAALVDKVEDVIDFPEDGLSAPPKMHALANCMIGICHIDIDLVYVLDVDCLLAPIDLLEVKEGSELRGE